jgi:hypothetical protein
MQIAKCQLERLLFGILKDNGVNVKTGISEKAAAAKLHLRIHDYS